MRATLLGTGSAMPSPDRLQTGVLLERDAEGSDSEERDAEDLDGKTLLIDCGGGALHRLAQADVAHDRIDTVLLTHHHLDHVADLPSLAKARVLDDLTELTIVGPPDTEVICDHLFAVDDLDERLDLSVAERAVEDFPLEVAGFEIAAAETTHSKQCFAYRVDDRLAISGDTAIDDDVLELADGADVLVHECAYPDGTDTEGHTTPSELGQALQDKNVDVDRVYLTHLFPETEAQSEQLRDTVASHTDANVRVATDLTTIELAE